MLATGLSIDDASSETDDDSDDATKVPAELSNELIEV